MIGAFSSPTGKQFGFEKEEDVTVTLQTGTDLSTMSPIFVNVASEGYSCSICGKKYTSHSSSARHYRHVHLNQAVYRCEICNKGFIKIE